VGASALAPIVTGLPVDVAPSATGPTAVVVGLPVKVVLVTLALITLEMVVEVILTGRTTVTPVITVDVAGVTDRLPVIRRAPVVSIVRPLKVDVA
jgi:hypothetical protein